MEQKEREREKRSTPLTQFKYKRQAHPCFSKSQLIHNIPLLPFSSWSLSSALPSKPVILSIRSLKKTFHRETSKKLKLANNKTGGGYLEIEWSTRVGVSHCTYNTVFNRKDYIRLYIYIYTYT